MKNNVLKTGYRKLNDKYYGGIKRGELTILYARPGMGKSAFLSNVFLNMISQTPQIKRSRDCDRIDCTTINYHLYNHADKVLGVYRKDYFMTIKDIERIKKAKVFCVSSKIILGSRVR